jgi:hypothetical protein
MGNCAEKAFLAGIFIKALMTNSLKQQGFSSIEVASANIQISIADEGHHDGDHTVCLLSYNIDGDKTLIVDPWINGTVYHSADSQSLFGASFVFDNICENKTLAVNDDGCVKAVMDWAGEVFDQDPQFSRLFNFDHHN